MKTSSSRRAGFTLVEILVVIGIIMLLAAILFPTFSRAQESARQASCASNLKQIYFAVKAYHADERRYPDSLMDLLPEGAKVNGGDISATSGTGYLKGGADLLTCPSDDTDPVVARSSYGALLINKDIPATGASAADLPNFAPAADKDASQYAWNYWGYSTKGYALPTEGDAQSVATGNRSLLLNPLPATRVYDKTSNPIKYSLSNRFAPDTTIITHCMYHRLNTAKNLNGPLELYATAADNPNGGENTRDIVLRLDGSAPAIDVSQWNQPTPGPSKWQLQQ